MWQVYKKSGENGAHDKTFLARCFQKLLLNFTWWVNQKDKAGNNIFGGGFLGLDNIGIFDRSAELPNGGDLEQADGTGWVAFYCLTMLKMSLELAEDDLVYEDLASKFFEHFVHIHSAVNKIGGQGLWDETSGFYYDSIKTPQEKINLQIRSLVGLVPFFACKLQTRFHLFFLYTSPDSTQ